MDLNLLWFVLLGVLLAGYAILDGFDLGVGILHLCVREDRERRLLMNSIGPLWDGNTVWLVTFGGAMFAAFPEAYATAFSGFYVPFMVLMFALVFRAVSMEFRSKQEWPGWRAFWDGAFFLASLTATAIYGGAVGASLEGMPLGPDHEYAGTPADLIRFYPNLISLLAVATFAMHGSIYLYLKTEGELQQRIHGWMWRTFFCFLACHLTTTFYTLACVPMATRNFERYPWLWAVVVLKLLAVANIPRAIYLGRPLYAFISSSCTLAGFVFFFGAALYPHLIVSTVAPDAHSLDIYNAASSPATLGIMAAIAFLGMPFVMGYTVIIYWVFRGKVRLGKFSY
jgi:cytochrome d ubiquinol oxidase subunit II